MRSLLSGWRAGAGLVLGLMALGAHGDTAPVATPATAADRCDAPALASDARADTDDALRAAFVGAAGACMARMHDGMHAALAAPSGSPDAVFAAAMIAHHRGAIEMAQLELRYGRDRALRRLAQEIVITQEQEIRVMRAASLDGTRRPRVAGEPTTASAPRDPVSHRDRVYAAEQFSNTVSVTDPADDRLLGVIRLGDPQPANLSPLYRGQLLVHGLGFSPDHRTLVVVSVGSNSVAFVETATNVVKHVTYVGRSPHEAFFTPDGKEVWVTVRGEDYVAVLDPATYRETRRIPVPPGPGMQIFSPDGKYGYVCSSFTPETVVIDVASHRIVGRVKQESPFCPNIAATPDGRQVWLTLKDVGRTMVFDARPPFTVLKSLDTGPTTNHVNFAAAASGLLAYVTVGGRNEVQVFRTADFAKVATIPVGRLPHGVWPSGDGTRVYVGLENADALAAIDTKTNTVIATIPVGQAPQAIVYVPNAVPAGRGTDGLQPLGAAGAAVHLTLRAAGGATSANAAEGPTSVSLFEQGLTQVVQASASGLRPKQGYVLALSAHANGDGPLQALAAFTTNPAGSAIVNAVGPIRQLVQGDAPAQRRYLVIVEGTPAQMGSVVQIQAQ